MSIDNYIDSAQERVKLDIDSTSSLLQRIRTLQSNNAFWAHECEKLHTLGWYKFFLIVSCALNLAFIFGFMFMAWWLWLK